MLRHLLEMMPASNVSGPGRDSAINLLIKQVPRKSLKNPDNSLTLWVIDQGMKHTSTPCKISLRFLHYGGFKMDIDFLTNGHVYLMILNKHNLYSTSSSHQFYEAFLQPIN